MNSSDNNISGKSNESSFDTVEYPEIFVCLLEKLQNIVDIFLAFCPKSRDVLYVGGYFIKNFGVPYPNTMTVFNNGIVVSFV